MTRSTTIYDGFYIVRRESISHFVEDSSLESVDGRSLHTEEESKSVETLVSPMFLTTFKNFLTYHFCKLRIVHPPMLIFLHYFYVKFTTCGLEISMTSSKCNWSDCSVQYPDSPSGDWKTSSVHLKEWYSQTEVQNRSGSVLIMFGQRGQCVC